MKTLLMLSAMLLPGLAQDLPVMGSSSALCCSAANVVGPTMMSGFSIIGGDGKELAKVHQDGSIEVKGSCEEVIRVVAQDMQWRFVYQKSQYQEQAMLAEANARYVESLKNVIAAQKKQVEIYKKALADIERKLKRPTVLP